MCGSTFLLGPSSFDCQKSRKIPLFFLSLSSSLSLSVFPLSPYLFVFFLFPFISSLIPSNSHLFAPLHLISLSFFFPFSLFSFSLLFLLFLSFFPFFFLLIPFFFLPNEFFWFVSYLLFSFLLITFSFGLPLTELVK